jgi:xanthine/uracil/vitamin C permease (AzgA family)
MPEIIDKYSDWIAYVMFITATYMLANGLNFGFIVYGIGNVFLLMFGIKVKSKATIWASIMFILINSHAYYISLGNGN